MRLKTATTAALIFSAIVMLSWPWTVGVKPPAEAGRAALQTYASRSIVYFAIVMLSLFVTAALALLVLRQTRLEFRERSLKNLQELVEGTLKDHADQKEP